MTYSKQSPPTLEDWIESTAQVWISCTYNLFHLKVETNTLSDHQWNVFHADMVGVFASVARMDTPLSNIASELHFGSGLKLVPQCLNVVHTW